MASVASQVLSWSGVVGYSSYPEVVQDVADVVGVAGVALAVELVGGALEAGAFQAERSSSDVVAVLAGWDAAGTAIVRKASEAADSTSRCASAAAANTSEPHVDHGLGTRSQIQVSWIAGCDIRGMVGAAAAAAAAGERRP